MSLAEQFQGQEVQNGRIITVRGGTDFLSKGTTLIPNGSLFYSDLQKVREAGIQTEPDGISFSRIYIVNFPDGSEHMYFHSAGPMQKDNKYRVLKFVRSAKDVSSDESTGGNDPDITLRCPGVLESIWSPREIEFETYKTIIDGNTSYPIQKMTMIFDEEPKAQQLTGRSFCNSRRPVETSGNL